MKSAFRSVTAAAMLLLPLGAAMVAQPAAAQYGYRVSTASEGRVTNMSLNSDAGLRPGATLRVQVYATPGAEWMNVALGGSGETVRMRERAPGEYIGTHVIARGERIDPARLMTVRAGWGQGPVAVSFNYPPSFQQLAMGAGPAVNTAATVESFSMSPSMDEIAPGRVLHFRLHGTPRARAFVSIPDVASNVPLREVRPGVYVGNYTVRRADDPDAFRDARAILRSGNQRAVANVNSGQRYSYGYGR